MKLCSACLLGVNCRYDGKSKPDKKIIRLSKTEIFIPVCPEQLGGLSTPRIPAGIYGKSGKDVLAGRATVRTVKHGKDVTKQFIKGAKETLKIAKLLRAKEAILKAKSPSCGYGKTWRLTKDFANHIMRGDGVTAYLLKKNGIKVVSEEDLQF
jgi:uncharacterized protein YbbK (DUF523 family)